jgi:hypothetical protein
MAFAGALVALVFLPSRAKEQAEDEAYEGEVLAALAGSGPDPEPVTPARSPVAA